MSLKTILALASFAALAGSVHAQTSWNIALTETVTASNNPAFQIGQSFTGALSYISDTENGTFYAGQGPGPGPFFPLPSGSNDSLTGSLPIGIAQSLAWIDGDIHADPDYGVVDYSATQTPYVNFLTVSNGVVTAFEWSTQLDWNDPSFGEGGAPGLNFEFYTGGPQNPTFITTGTVAFSLPVEPAVPDHFPVVALFGFGLVALGTLRYATTRSLTPHSIR